MGIWSAIWKTETRSYIYGRLRPNQVQGTYGEQRSIAADGAYVSAMLRKMRIPYSRQGWNAYSGAVHCFSEHAYRNEAGKVQLHAIATPLELDKLAPKQMANIEVRQRRLFGPIPYRGGDLSLELGLFALRTDLSAPYLALLGKVAALAGVPYATTALQIADTVKTGVDSLRAQTSLEIGIVNTFPEVITGCYVLVAKDTYANALDDLTVDVDGTLFSKGVPVTEPYVVFSIDATTNREDFLSLPDVGPAYKLASQELRHMPPDPARLEATLRSLRAIAMTSPDLRVADADRICSELEQNAVSLVPTLPFHAAALEAVAESVGPAGRVLPGAQAQPQWADDANEESVAAVPRACGADEAVKRARSMVRNGGQYELGTGDYRPDGAHDLPWTQNGGPAGSDCAGFAISWCYKLPRHRPGYNRGSWASVSDDLNCNSVLEDAQHAKELFTLVADAPRPGDLLLYPTIHLAGKTFIGHVAIVVGCDRAAAFQLDAPDWSLLDVAQCCGPNGRAPAVLATSGVIWNQHDQTWPKPEHRSWLVRPVAPPPVAVNESVPLSDFAKRNAIAGMVKLDRVQGTDEAVQEAVDTGPLDPHWLQQIRDARAELAAKGEAAMQPYRDFYNKPDLTVAELDALLGQMEFAIGQPERFFDAAQEAPLEEGVVSWLTNMVKTGLSLPDPLSEEQQKGLAQLRVDFTLGNDIIINPNDHTFETSDPGWWHLLKADKWDKRHWPEGLAPFIEHGPGRTFIYGDVNVDRVALFSDFGVGQYHSRFIAKQLEQRAYKYAFHLGDVYYGGSSEEFAHSYTTVLDGVMNKTKLFSMPENHELYGGGVAWQAFIASELQKRRIIQDGSYFCMRFAKHQIVALDVNWHGRQRFRYEPCREWLRRVLAEGKDLTTILLTGSAPYGYGEEGTTDLYDDLAEWHAKGLFHAWFWGDDHYCALFKPTANHKFVGSCIGHAGFPGDKQEDGKQSAAPTEWVELAPRFPDGYGLRDDLTNNGWVELFLSPSGGIELQYIDWLSQKRLHVTYKMVGSGSTGHLELANRVDFARRGGPF